ncbi:MAG: cell division protein FtsA [Lactobacillaceae bacterium]|nr:cell division protein FtsA [Lactobacillaceae bacterium]
MANHGVVVGLDVGTSMVKVLVADVRDQQVNVIAVGRAVSHGVRRGVVVDIDATAKDILEALQQVAEQTDEPVTEVIASIPATAIKMQQVTGTVSVQDSQHISYADVQSAVLQAMSIPLVNDRTIVDLTPTEFIVDDFDGVQDPNDMVGVHLTMKGIAYTGPRQLVTNLRSAIEKAGLQLRDMVLAPLALTKTVATDAEQEFGTVIMDMGAGQTTAMIVHNHLIKYITTFPAGGTNISKDISAVLGIAAQEGDILKLDAAVANPSVANPDNQLTIKVVGKEAPQRISETYLAEIVGARVDQILSQVGERLESVSGFQLPGGVIITGGAAALRGLPEAIHDKFGVMVRLFVPNEIGLRHPAYVGAWSVVHYAAKQTQVQLIVKQALYDLPLTFITPNLTQTTKPSLNLRIPKPRPQTTPSQSVVEQPVTTQVDTESQEPKLPLWQRLRTGFADMFFN